jgi:small GTP-binding protein
LSYPGSNVMLVCFSMVNPISLENVLEKWIPEVSHHCPEVPIILVGTKCDLVNDSETLGKLKKTGLNVVNKEQINEAMKKIKAQKFILCSSRTKEGVSTLFEESIRSVLAKRIKVTKKKEKCLIL